MDADKRLQISAKRANRLCDIVRFATSSSSAIRYLGWVGRKNLGDEALLEAARDYFAPLPLAHLRRVSNRAISRLLRMKHHAAALLGGGTLIGTDYLADYQDIADHGHPFFVFGTGVQAPSFWADLGKPIPLDAWVPVLNAAAYVGVRGPRSASDLDSLGVASEVLGDPIALFVRPNMWTPTERRIGLNIGTARGRLWGDEEQLIDGMAEFARARVAAGWRIEWFVVWPQDLPTVHATCRRAGLSDPKIHETYQDARFFMKTVSRMQLFVGMKLHAVALALCAGVPAISIAYQPKCLDFMDSLDLGEFTITTDTPRLPSVLEELTRSIDLEGRSVSERATQHLMRYRLLQQARAKKIVELIRDQRAEA